MDAVSKLPGFHKCLAIARKSKDCVTDLSLFCLHHSKAMDFFVNDLWWANFSSNVM